MDITQRETLFREEVFSYTIYAPQMLEQFFDYWSEPNKRAKMRFELEKTWDLKRRLKRWSENNLKWSHERYNQNNGTVIKLGTSAARIASLKKWGYNEDGSWGIKSGS